MENVTNLVCHPKMQIWKDTPSLRISSPRQDFFYMAVSGDAIKYNKLSQKQLENMSTFNKAQTTFFDPTVQLLKFHPKEIISHEVRDIDTMIFIQGLFLKTYE